MKKIILLSVFCLINCLYSREEILPGDYKDIKKMRAKLGPNFEQGTIKDFLIWAATTCIGIEDEMKIHFYYCEKNENLDSFSNFETNPFQCNVNESGDALFLLNKKFTSEIILMCDNYNYSYKKISDNKFKCNIRDYFSACSAFEKDVIDKLRTKNNFDNKKSDNKNNKKWWIIGGAVVALVVVAGVGYYLYSKNQNIEI